MTIQNKETISFSLCAGDIRNAIENYQEAKDVFGLLYEEVGRDKVILVSILKELEITDGNIATIVDIVAE